MFVITRSRGLARVFVLAVYLIGVFVFTGSLVDWNARARGLVLVFWSVCSCVLAVWMTCLCSSWLCCAPLGCAVLLLQYFPFLFHFDYMCLDVCTLGERGLVGVLVLTRSRGLARVFVLAVWSVCAFWLVGPSVLVRARGSCSSWLCCDPLTGSTFVLPLPL